MRQAASHEYTSLGHTPRACAWRVRLGHMTTPSSPFNQHPAPVEPGPCPERNSPRASPNAGALGAAHATPVASPQLGCGRGGGERIRTDDLLLAKQALSQLSYTPSRDQKSEHRDQKLPISDLWRWWAREDLNLRPHAYQARALTS